MGTFATFYLAVELVPEGKQKPVTKSFWGQTEIRHFYLTKLGRGNNWIDRLMPNSI